jgi:seryl-tRNA synthetase
MSFENQIQKWVSIDNEIKKLNEKTKLLRETRNQLSEDIISYANEKKITNSTIKISDGKLKFTNTKVTEPLTFKYIENTLAEIIMNESQLKYIIDHLKNKRTSKIIPELKRYSES